MLDTQLYLYAKQWLIVIENFIPLQINLYKFLNRKELARNVNILRKMARLLFQENRKRSAPTFIKLEAYLSQQINEIEKNRLVSTI